MKERDHSKINRSNKLLAGVFSLVVFLLVILSAISFNQTKKQQSSSEWVRRSFVKIIKIEEHLSLLRDVQIRHRAFLLTKDSSFKEEYDSLKFQVNRTGTELDSLFIENPEQQELLRDLHQLVQKRHENMDMAISLSRTHKIEELSPLLMSGFVVMDSLRIKVKLLESIENQALKDQIEKKEKGDKRVVFWILLFSLSSLFVVLLSFLFLKREISKRTKAEIDSEALDRLVDERTSEILSANRQLKEKNVELERKNSEIDTFNFITSHDLQEPLRKIETFIQYIKDEPEGMSLEVKRSFERITESARRMRDLIGAIAIYSKYAQSQKFIPVDLNHVAQNAIEKEDKLIKEKNARIEVSDLPVISANLQQMEALFKHLINNSLKYSKEDRNPIIKIAAKKLTQKDKDDSIWRINFSDNGIGFDDKYNDRIYTLFQRLHDHSGIGLGLPICRRVVENHNGSISATSKPGVGTTITVFLPENQFQADTIRQ